MLRSETNWDLFRLLPPPLRYAFPSYNTRAIID